MDRATRLKLEESYERHGGIVIPSEIGKIFIPRGTKGFDGPRTKGHWGEGIRLEAGVDVFTPKGELMGSHMWESKSFTRWFGRLMQSWMDGVSPSLTDFQGTIYTANVGNSAGGRLIPNVVDATGAQFGLFGGQENTGAMLAIGNGPLTGAQSGFVNLKNLLFFQDAHIDGITTQDDGVQMTVFYTTGITLAVLAGATITEIGMFARIQAVNGGNPHLTLMTYDEVNPGVAVAYGGVIAPKYQMTFAA